MATSMVHIVNKHINVATTQKRKQRLCLCMSPAKVTGMWHTTDLKPTHIDIWINATYSWCTVQSSIYVQQGTLYSTAGRIALHPAA